ncbi:MAG: hypothetical protein ACOVO5_10515 [Devosia sp.]|jgi:hypothetical protein|uniref:hypothetical protein n=1 Tax=Devosia sp. TaxID=1871048 RepID=UPI0037C0F31E
MTKTKLALALLALVAGTAGVSQAMAGAGSYQLGSSMFEDRCTANGGYVVDIVGGSGCELDGLQIGCSFSGATTYCEWDGAQNLRPVSRVLGAAVAESLSEPVAGGQKKKLIWNPDIIKNFKF